MAHSPVSHHGRWPSAGTLLLLSALLTSGAAAAAGTTVVPTGVFPDDVENVQAAVDAGGSVHLAAVDAAGTPTAFNFGSPEALPGRSILLSADVELVGDTSGGHRATIRGGFVPIQQRAPIRSRIANIELDGPLAAAIFVAGTRGLQIVGNTIDGVVPLPLARGFSDGEGILVSGSDDPNAIQGPVLIADNVVDHGYADLSTGIQVDDVATDSEITGNRIGIVQTFGIGVFRAGAHVLIADNVLTGKPPAAIEVGGRDTARYEIRHNTVLMPANVFGVAILLSGGNFGEGATDHAVIASNHVTGFDPTFLGIGAAGLVSNSDVRGNRVDGQGFFALLASTGFAPDDPDLSTGNRFQGNDLSLFRATVADVLFDVNTLDTTLVGHCRSIVDLGTANSATCEGPHAAAAAAARLRASQADRFAALGRMLARPLAQ